MFNEEIVRKIYGNAETEDIPVGYLAKVTHIIEDVLEEMGYDFEFQQSRNASTGNAD